MRLDNIKHLPYTLLVVPLLFLAGCQQLNIKAEPEAVEQTAALAHQPALVAAEPVMARTPAETCPQPHDIWNRLSKGFRLSGYEHPRVENDLAWYARHQGYLDRVAERAEPYLHLIVEEVEKRGLPSEIALLPVVESAFQPFAYSHGRAAGLWQFVPGTGRRFGLKQTWWYDGRRDVEAATHAALDYLEYLNKLFDGDWLHALAAYNSGEGTVMRAIRRNKKRGKPTDYWSLDLPVETRGYVPKLLAISAIVDNPVKHGVLIASIEDRPYLTHVDVDSQIDLDLAAELAELSLEEIYLYNPGFNRWATDPKGPHRLLVPVDNADSFRTRLAEYPENGRINWQRHRIKEGESLISIAAKHRTTVSLLKQVNGISSNNIRAGHYLNVPVARTDINRYTLSSSQRLASLQNRDRTGNKVEYRVKTGDTLWEIARRYDVSVRQLASWNGMAPRDALRAGQKLVIWTTENTGKVSAVNPAEFQHPFEKTTIQRIGYTVRSGDSLAAISQRFRVSVDSLKRWNKLHGQKYLQPGQRLTLYVDVRRQSGSI